MNYVKARKLLARYRARPMQHGGRWVLMVAIPERVVMSANAKCLMALPRHLLDYGLGAKVRTEERVAGYCLYWRPLTPEEEVNREAAHA